MKFIDAHIHLPDKEYEEHLNKIIEDARNSNVVALVSNSMNLQSSFQSIELAEKHLGLVYAALGIHPWNVKELLPNEIEDTIKLILDSQQQGNVVAIGEIGLDYKYVKGGKQELLKTQYEVFYRMLQLSEKLSLPAIIHSRGTTPEILDMLHSYNIEKVLLHWFSSPIELLPKIVDCGYYITEGPPTVYSSQTQDIVRRVPLTNLLTETDGPVRYFKPPFEGKMTTPAFIPQIVEAIAEIKNMPKGEVAEQICKNFSNFFGIAVK
jgi:TatD DNase family protein